MDEKKGTPTVGSRETLNDRNEITDVGSGPVPERVNSRRKGRRERERERDVRYAKN